MGIVYRKAEAKDVNNWVYFVNMVWRDAYKDIFPQEVFEYQDEIASKKSEKIAKLTDNEASILYIAEYDNEIVGIMWGELNSSYEYFHDEYADLVALYIDPKFQGQGIATKLRNTFESWAKSKGATKYVIGVLKDNDKARNIYEKWGGKLSEHEQDFVKLDVGYREVFYTYNL